MRPTPCDGAACLTRGWPQILTPHKISRPPLCRSSTAQPFGSWGFAPSGLYACGQEAIPNPSCDNSPRQKSDLLAVGENQPVY